jgi:hypothetical protein
MHPDTGIILALSVIGDIFAAVEQRREAAFVDLCLTGSLQ